VKLTTLQKLESGANDLMGAKVGQIVTVAAPAGDVQYKVDKIER